MLLLGGKEEEHKDHLSFAILAWYSMFEFKGWLIKTDNGDKVK